MDNLIEDIKTYVREVIDSTSPTKVDDIKLFAYAANRNIGIRTIQRRLAEYNTTYKDIRDSVRKEKVIGLVELGLSTLLITKVLAYRESKQVVRGFKRWFGKTPSTYRMEFNNKQLQQILGNAHEQERKEDCGSGSHCS